MFWNTHSTGMFLLLFSFCAGLAGVPEAVAASPEPQPPMKNRGYPPSKGRPRGPYGHLLSRCTPEERQQIKQLARDGKKEELQTLVNQLLKKYRPPELKKLDELSEKYQLAKTDKERTAIKQEMTIQAKVIFAKRQEFTKQNIEQAERRLIRYQQNLEHLKKHYKLSEQNAEKIIAQRVEELCMPPDQRPSKPLRPPMPPRSLR